MSTGEDDPRDDINQHYLEDKAKPITIEMPMGLCSVCKKTYGKANLTLMGKDVYLACDCLPQDRVYFIDADKMVIK
jgi:hypothetical protein